MRIAVIGDRHTVLGFALAGVEGKEPGDNPAETLNDYMNQDDLGVLIITSGAAEALQNEIERWKKERNFPIVVEIREHGKEITKDRINALLKRAVGMEAQA